MQAMMLWNGNPVPVSKAKRGSPRKEIVEYRAALYCPALVAAKHNAHLKISMTELMNNEQTK